MRSLTVALALCCLAAAPAAGARQPLRSGAVIVHPDGAVVFHGAPLGKLTLPPPPWALTVSQPAVEGHRLVHVVVRGAAARSAELIAEPGAAPPVIFVGLTGPQGVDGEWSRHLRVAPAGLVLFERREGITRCDGQPVYLFPRRYDFRQRRFRPASPPLPPAPRAPELVARRERPPDAVQTPAPIFRIVAASTHAGDGQRAADLVPPTEADDGDPTTSWAEGLGSAGGGEFLTATAPPSPYPLRAIQIIPGDTRDREAFAAANRLQRAMLALSAETRFRIRFPRDPLRDAGSFRAPYWIVLPKPVATRCATLIVEQVYRGSAARGDGGQGRTAIAELRFFTELDFGGGAKQLVRDLESDDAARHGSAAQILARLGAEAAASLLPLLATAEPPVLRRVVDVIARAPYPAAAGPLAAALGRMPPMVRQRGLEALQAIGAAAVPSVTPLLADSDEAVRAAAAVLLGRLGGPAARAALLAAAGTGSDRYRAAVVEGLAAAPSAELLDAVLAAAREARRGVRAADLVLAVGRLGAALRDAARAGEAAAALAQLWQALPAAEDAFELRYRLLGAIGGLDAEGQRALLVRAAAHREPVLRWVAVRQLTRAAQTTPALVRALNDRDPRVRATAATALARRRGERIARALAQRLGGERWTFVGSALADALASHCGVTALSALRRAVAAGRPGVEEAALISIAACRPPKLFGELVAIARDARRRDALRERALALLPAPPSASDREQVVSLLLTLRREALVTETGERLAIAAARAVGQAGDAAAARVLVDTLSLDPQPAIRAAASRAVGFRCHAAARDAIRQATRDANALVRQAAKKTAARCHW